MVIPNATLDQAIVSTYITQFEDIIVTKFVIALIILFIGLLAGLLIGKITLKLLRELDVNTLFKNYLGYDLKLDEVIAKGLTWLIYVITVLLVLYQLGVATFVVNAASIFIILLALVLITLSMKDFVPNFIAGLKISRRDLFTIGDQVRVDRFEGTIVDMELLEVLVETKGGDILMVPSSYLLHNVVRIKAGPISRKHGRLPSLIKEGFFAKKAKKLPVQLGSSTAASTQDQHVTQTTNEQSTKSQSASQTVPIYDFANASSKMSAKKSVKKSNSTVATSQKALKRTPKQKE
jgi:hypothetical protein